jgi:hypothetical protein
VVRFGAAGVAWGWVGKCSSQSGGKLGRAGGVGFWAAAGSGGCRRALRAGALSPLGTGPLLGCAAAAG